MIVNVFDNGVGKELDLRVLLCPFEHDLGSAKAAAAMNKRYLGGKASEERRLFHSGVATAHHHDFLSGKEKAITGCARGNTMADELLLVGQAQPPGGSAAGDDQRLRMDLMLAKMEQERTLAQISTCEVSHAIFRAETLRLLAHVLDELRTHDSLGKAGEVFYQRREGELAAGFVAFYYQRFQIGPGRVERGGVSSATRTNDYDIASFAHDFVKSSVRLRI